MIGAGCALAGGFAIGLIQGDDGPGMFSMSGPTKGMVLGVLLMPVGLIVGAVAAPGGRWDRISLGRSDLALSAEAGGRSGLFLSVGF